MATFYSFVLQSLVYDLVSMDEKDEYELSLLLRRFNARDTEAFVAVYKLLFTEMHLYASRLYANTTVAPEDTVQDVFCYLWEKTDARFEHFTKLKAFLYVAIKNKYRSYLEHLKVQEKYHEHLEKEKEFSEEILENEVYASLLRYIEFLPNNYAQVMRLYLSGYETEEIAKMLHLSLQTVYNIKSLAIRLLKDKLSRVS